MRDQGVRDSRGALRLLGGARTLTFCFLCAAHSHVMLPRYKGEERAAGRGAEAGRGHRTIAAATCATSVWVCLRLHRYRSVSHMLLDFSTWPPSPPPGAFCGSSIAL